jgi:hypothetical protein
MIKKILAFFWALLFYIFLFPITMLIIVIGPLMTYLDLLEVYKYEAPRISLGLPALCFLGIILFLSMKYSSLKWIYKKFPVLLPFLQMCFISLFAMEIGLQFANLWADKLVYGKGIAIGLSVLSIILGRMFLSYWYYKYPISHKVFR